MSDDIMEQLFQKDKSFFEWYDKEMVGSNISKDKKEGKNRKSPNKRSSVETFQESEMLDVDQILQQGKESFKTGSGKF